MKGRKKIEYQKGEQVGTCTFVREAEPLIQPSKKKERKAVFLCECGSEFEALISHVKSGNTKSCGCMKNELISNARTTHGLTHDPIFSKWVQMKKRCYNPNAADYKNYGGRGIIVCKEWRNDFLAFRNYISKLEGYGEDGRSLDRIDNNGNYEPGNMRWATRHEQSVNQRMKKTNTSGYVGVSLKGERFKAMINVHNERIYIGTYDTKVEAVEARDMHIIKSGLWEYPLQVITSNKMVS